MDWARMLAYVTGTVDQELLARNHRRASGTLSGGVLEHGWFRGEALEMTCSSYNFWDGSSAPNVTKVLGLRLIAITPTQY